MKPNILSVTAVTDNFPDGQKITAARIQYDCDASYVHPERLRVEGKTVKAAYAVGDTVTLELEPTPLIPSPPKPTEEAGGQPSPQKGPPNLPPAVRLPVEVTVVADGVAYRSEHSIEPVVEDFQQFQLNGMGYNLYIPKMEEGKTYPLVLFIHDAGVCGPDVKTTLSQGNGAVSFASPEWQGEHPCFVLAPQVDKGPCGPMTNDDFEVTEDFVRVKQILDHVMEIYPVDTDRLYATGQSMGCMASCEFNIRYPDMFAASLLVAGQWHPEKMAQHCSHNKLWILVSQGDAKAFPGMNAVTDAIEQEGVRIGRYCWNAKTADLETEVQKALWDDVTIRYTVFEDSSVVPEKVEPNPGANHISTWPVVYRIDGLKQWMFSNSREKELTQHEKTKQS